MPVIGFLVISVRKNVTIIMKNKKVDTTKWLSPNLIIPIEHIDPDLVRAYLSERAIEVHMKEPVAHKILEFFGL